MPDVRTVTARSTAFVDHGTGTGEYVYSLEDGSCLKIKVTLTQASLHLEDLAKAISREVRKKP